MNEMNNGENNNQNFEQQNMNQNNVVQPVQQNVEQSVSEPSKKEEKKSYCGLLIVFMVISLLLAGFIVYDKVLKKEEKDISIDEPQKKDEPRNEIALHNYYRIDIINKKLNGKDIKIELKHWIEKPEIEYDEEGNPVSYMDETVGYFTNIDLYINGKFLKQVGSYDISNSLGLNEKEAINLLDNNQGYAKYLNSVKTFEIIKGDKDYLYHGTFHNGASWMNLLVLNENGDIILEKKLGHDFRLVNLDKSTLNYQKFANQCEKDGLGCNTALYYLETDAIYYVEDDGKCEDEFDTIPQYKVTFKENKANIEKIADCKYEAEGACA